MSRTSVFGRSVVVVATESLPSASPGTVEGPVGGGPRPRGGKRNADEQQMRLRHSHRIFVLGWRWMDESRGEARTDE